MNALLVAVDGGPRETLAPLARHWHAELADVADSGCRDESYWAALIAQAAPELVIVGTSDSARGRAIEHAVRAAAHNSRRPLVAIEDFPGNYTQTPADADLVVVESAAAADLLRRRISASRMRVEVVAPVRYDPYRARLAELRAAINNAWRRQTGAQTVLWAGQPETEDSVATLRALAPALRGLGVTVMLKAHPRDAGYEHGVYQQLLEAEGIRHVDVTRLDVEETLAHAPRIAITQFSSVAIEAGFFGIPGVFVLLAGAGSTRLNEKKGYLTPPPCASEAMGLITQEAAILPVLTGLIRDDAWRHRVVRCFDDYFATRAPALPQLLNVLANRG